MNPVAKFTIVIPLLIVAAAVLIRVNKPSQQLLIPSKLPSTIEVSTGVSNNGETNAPPTAKLDLKGPFACSYSKDTISMKVFILNKQMYSKYSDEEKVKYMLVKGDCLYLWEHETKNGRKICGVGQYLSLADSFSQLPFFSPEALFPYLKKFQPDIKLNAQDLNDVIKTCKKNELDEVLFSIPLRVTFMEENITQSPEDFLK